MAERLEARVVLDGSLVISELLADNEAAWFDDRGEASDYIEIYNAGSEPVNTAGWSLTDDPTELDQWRFPSMIVEPGGYLLVAASGLDQRSPDRPLHTNFRLSAEGEYLALVAPGGEIVSELDPFPLQREDISYGLVQDVTTLVATDSTVRYWVPKASDQAVAGEWFTPEFDDSAWPSAALGIGHGLYEPGFSFRMLDITGGTDGRIASAFEAELIVNQAFPPGRYNVVTDVTRGVDRIDFGDGAGSFPATQPYPADSDEEDLIFIVKAQVQIPEGDWTIGFGSDDGGFLRLDGVEFFGEFNTSADTPGDDEIRYQGRRAHDWTTAQFTVGPGGLSTDLYALVFQSDGSSSIELALRPGHHEGGVNTAEWKLLEDGVFGWTVIRPGSSLVQTDLQEEMAASSSLWVRSEFELEDVPDFDNLFLRLRYNDGVAVYLNGQLAAQANAPEALGVDARALAERSATDSGRFQNFSLTPYMDLLHPGTNTLAIHVLSETPGDESLLLVPELVGIKDQAEYKFFVEPTPGTSNRGGVVDFVGELAFSETRGFFDEPFQLRLSTPTAGATIRYTLDGSQPSATRGQIYSGPITISSTSVVRAVAVKSGLQPSLVQSHTYLFLEDVIRQGRPAGWPSGPINGQVLDYGMDRRITESAEWGPQMIEALTQIPTISISTDRSNLFDSRTGIYVNAGGRGRAWERTASIEMIDPNTGEQFGVNGGIRIRGGFSRNGNNPKHAFRIFFRKEHGGPGKLNFPLFGDEGADSFDDFDLRTAQNYSWSYLGDNRNTFLRDIFSRDVQGQMGQPYKRGNYYHLYINGQYWGLYQTDEHAEASYAAQYFGGNKEDYDVIKNGGGSGIEATDGDTQAYRRLWLATNAGYSSNEAYFRVQGMNPDGTRNPAYERLLDVDNLIDYMIITYFTADMDGPGSRFTQPRPNNFFAIYNRVNPDGFKWFEHDSEHSLDTGAGDMVNPLTLEHPGFSSSNFNYFNPQWLHERLMDNAEYRQRFADRVYETMFGDGPLAVDNALALVQQRAAQIDKAIIAESARWGDSKSSSPFTKNHWLQAVQRVENFIRTRHQSVIRQLLGRQWYPETGPAQITVNGDPWDGQPISADDQLRLEATQIRSTDTLLAASQNLWFYNDLGIDLGTAWRARNYDHSNWKKGFAELGYGDGDEAGVISFGSDPDHKHRTYYFRNQFLVQDPSIYKTLILRLKRDDGAVVYINGVEVARSNMPNGPITYQTPALAVVGGQDESQFVEFQFDASMLLAGPNILAVEVHQANDTSTDVSFDLELIGREELQSHDAIYYTLDGSDPRMIGGQVAPGVKVYDGQPLQLSGNQKLAARVFSGGEWSPLMRAELNIDAPPPEEGELVISEIYYRPHPALVHLGEPNVDDGDFEFVEIANHSGHDIDLAGLQITAGITFTFPSRTLVNGQRAVVVKNDVAFRARFPNVDPSLILGEFSGSLSNAGEELRLQTTGGKLIYSVVYDDEGDWPEDADGSGSSLELRHTSLDPQLPTSWQASVEFGGTPGRVPSLPIDPPVIINEVLAHTDPPQSDSIELYNRTNAPVDISGWYVSDSEDNLLLYQFPANTVIPPGGYLVLTEEDFNPGGGLLPNDFAISSTGEDLWLWEADPVTRRPVRLINHVDFEATLNGMALGRVPNGSPQWDLFPLTSVTLGQPNAGPRVPELAISEIHYNPPGSADNEYVELRNNLGTPLDISGWRVDGGVDYVFPPQTIVPPHGLVVLVGFDPNDAQMRADFLAQFVAPLDTIIVGPWENGAALSNSGEELRVQLADEPPAGEIDIPYVTIDRVLYGTSGPWPTSANNLGHSLHRRSTTEFGDDPANWRASAPSPGRIVAPGDVNLDGLLDAADIDLISAAIRDGSNSLVLDVTEDLVVNSEDRRFLIENLLGAREGDTDLDGDVDTADQLNLITGWTGALQAGEGDQSWSDGDVDGDGDTDTADLNTLILNWTGSQATDSSLAAALVDAAFQKSGKRRASVWF